MNKDKSEDITKYNLYEIEGFKEFKQHYDDLNKIVGEDDKKCVPRGIIMIINKATGSMLKICSGSVFTEMSKNKSDIYRYCKNRDNKKSHRAIMEKETEDTITHCKKDAFLNDFYLYGAENFRFIFKPLNFKEDKTGSSKYNKNPIYKLVNPEDDTNFDKLMLPRYNFLNKSLKDKKEFANLFFTKYNNGVNMNSFMDAAGYTKEDIYDLVTVKGGTSIRNLDFSKGKEIDIEAYRRGVYKYV